MATNWRNKSVSFCKVTSESANIPECPVCLATMTTPIYQCSSGHSLCSSCTKNLCPAICPICRHPMTHMRNWQLEDIVLKMRVACPNKSDGCGSVMLGFDMEEHLKECIYRQIDCPHGAVFRRCNWNGKLKDLLDHFKWRHPTFCSVSSESEVELDNIDIDEDERLVYLVTFGRNFFIITIVIDTSQRMAYLTVQLIGGKATAHQYVYEIHVISKQDDRRKVVFIEHCFSDGLKADEVISLNKCAVLPVDALKHFVSDKKLAFRFFIKRVASSDFKARGDDQEENRTRFLY